MTIKNFVLLYNFFHFIFLYDADSFVIMAVYHSFCATATIVKHLHTEFISGTRLFWFIRSPYV